MHRRIAQARSLAARVRRPRRGDAVGLIYGIMGLLLVAYLVLLIVRPADQSSTAIDGWGVDAFELSAGVLCIVGGIRRRPGSAVPIVLGAALISWALGDVVITIDSRGGGHPPPPGPADPLYLGFFALSYVAVVLLVRGETR